MTGSIFRRDGFPTDSCASSVGQNIEELSYFMRDKLKSGFRRLLETYYDRVDAAETDKSMLVNPVRSRLSSNGV